MSPEQGVISAKVMSLADLCDGMVPIGQKERWFEFGIRWVDGEIANDILVLETDGYCEVEDSVDFQGQFYELEFGEDLLRDTLKYNARLGETKRPNLTVALRYHVEFDAFLELGQTRTGGKWSWGGGRGREEKRKPEDFLAVWCR